MHGNAGKLQQVFLNLFLNARDAMGAGGTLEVRTWAEGGGVRIEVADTGHGIAPENLHRIYDPFFTTKAARKGTGPRALGDLRYHSRAWRFHRSLQPAGRRRAFPPGAAALAVRLAGSR